MRQLASGGGIQSLLGQDAVDIEEEGQEEALEINELMENAKVSYECFISGNLKTNSHSVQWLPYQEQDPDFPQFNNEFFLFGTHFEEEDNEA